MIPILKSEYSFKQCYSPIEKLVAYAKDNDMKSLGIADAGNTFGHYYFSKECEKQGIKPIFGVRLNTLPDSSKQRTCHLPWIYVAKNNAGLVELYGLVKKAYDQFYYTHRLYFSDALRASDNIAVLSPYRVSIGSLEGDTDAIRLDYLGGLTYFDVKAERVIPNIEHRYITPNQKPIYQLLAGVTKRGTTYIQNFDQKTYSQHIWSDSDYLSEGGSQEAITYSEELASQCNAKLPSAPMIKYKKGGDLQKICERGARRLNIDLSDPVYKERLAMELELINSRDFHDYFLIVSDILTEARKTSLVGPGRGSSGGSLVCYLMGITELDPIKYDLLFARFIDPNRDGLPDIDTDIPDIARQSVIKYMKKLYGSDNVCAIGTVMRYKAKSVITEFAKSLNIPPADTEDMKNAIIERSSGDARAGMCIMDTFEGSEIGKEFVKKYPAMKLTQYAEGHANHAGKHAAGIIVSNLPIDNYCGLDSRNEVLMTEGGPAESVGLLKIDVLGLRTLTVLQETARLAGFSYKDYYKLVFDDQRAFSIFNEARLHGIFQFEGKALAMLTKQMGVNDFEDICAITALGRPGALNTGAASRYVACKNGEKEIEYLGGLYDEVTSKTYGNVIYQEQTMNLLRNYGNLSWDDVNQLRRALSKSYGDEFFNRYKDKFIAGAQENCYALEDAEIVWHAISSAGSYQFNRSHAVAYSMISYWTAWAKALYPIEFAAANLNHAKDNNSAIKLLRDFVNNDGINYIPVDPDVSDVKWSIYDGKLIGGLTNLDGIGIKKAQGIIKTRKNGRNFTPAILKKMLNPVTPFDILFPIEHFYGHLYEDPISHGLNRPPCKIIDAQDPGEYTVIGRIVDRDLRDRNDVQSVMRRGSKVDKDPFYLNLFIEDDTDDIKCTIPPYLFDELEGQKIAENVKLGETHMLIKGTLRDSWRNISITAIYDITDMARNRS